MSMWSKEEENHQEKGLTLCLVFSFVRPRESDLMRFNEPYEYRVWNYKREFIDKKLIFKFSGGFKGFLTRRGGGSTPERGNSGKKGYGMFHWSGYVFHLQESRLGSQKHKIDKSVPPNVPLFGKSGKKYKVTGTAICNRINRIHKMVVFGGKE